MSKAVDEAVRGCLLRDEGTLTRYKSILHSFASNEKKAGALAEELIHLANPQKSKTLRNMLGRQSQADVTGLHVYIQVKESLKLCCSVKDVVSFFTTVLWFVGQELLPIEFMIDRMMHFKNYFNEKAFPLVVETLKLWRDPVKLRKTRVALSEYFDCGDSRMFVNPKFHASGPFRIYVMARFLLKPEAMLSFVRCLALYASDMIKQTTASAWLKNLDPLLARYFMESNCVVEFHPSRILSQLSNCPWALGDSLLGALKKVPSMEKDTLLECAIDAVNHTVNLKTHFITLPETVAELKATKIYHALKECVHAIRTGDLDFSSAKPIIMDVVGRVGDEVTPTQAHLYMNALMKHARHAQRGYKRLLRARLSSLEVGSIEWREAYCKLLRRQSHVRDLTLEFVTFPVPEQSVALKAHRFVTEFLTHFKDLSVLYAQFVSIFRGGRYYCSCEGACALAYYYEIIKLSQSEHFNQDLVSLIFDEPPPIKHLQNEALGHIDVALLNFAKMLNRMDEGHFVSKISEIISNYDDDFLFEVEVLPGRVTIHSFTNPTAYATVSKK